MSTNHKNTTTKISYGKVIIPAIIVSLVCMFLGGMLLTTFMVSGSLDVKHMDLSTATVLLVASLIGSLYIKKMKGEGRGWLIHAFCAVMILILMFINLTIWGGNFNKLPMKLMAMAVGSSILLFDNRGLRKGGRKRKKR